MPRSQEPREASAQTETEQPQPGPTDVGVDEVLTQVQAMLSDLTLQHAAAMVKINKQEAVIASLRSELVAKNNPDG